MNKLLVVCPKRRLIQFAALLIAGYVVGAITVSQNWFPIEELKPIKIALFGPSLTEPTPRNALFEAFSPKADVVMIGDSITSAGEWSEIFPDIKIANRGISGETAEDILQRMGPILAVSPEKAFIMVGINDIYDGQSIDTIMTNYTNIIDQLLQRKITVYVQSTIECSVEKCGNKVYKVRALNERLKSYAIQRGIAFIDLNPALSSENQGLLKDYTYDGMHLSANGFIQWKKVIDPYVHSHNIEFGVR